MGVTKKELFSTAQNELASVAKIFAHPARVAILEHLLKTKTCVNGELVQELGLAQATISQHLREMKDSGIIQGNIEGVSVCYCIDAEKWQEINRTFQKLFDKHQKPAEEKCC